MGANDGEGVVATAYDHNTGSYIETTSAAFTDKRTSTCRDPIFALLFVINVVGIIATASAYGKKAFDDDDDFQSSEDDSNSDEMKAYVYMALGCSGGAVVATMAMFAIMMCIPQFLIKLAVFFNILCCAALVAFAIIINQIVLAIIAGVIFLISICWAFCVWSRIPFATANLVTACKAVLDNCSVILLSYIFVLISVGFTGVFAVAFSGVYEDKKDCSFSNCSNGMNGGIYALFILSYFFYQEVIKNTIHVIIGGTVGTWWFLPEEGKGCCSSGVLGSMKRALTTSFGSICFGSLLVAIIQTLKQLARNAREQGGSMALLACIAECILGCLESLLQYFNKWAFIYVGLYGFSYLESGKKVIELFKARGWDTIIADDLVGMTLFMLSFLCGLLSGVFGLFLEDQTSWFDDIGHAKLISMLIGLIVGLVLCLILMSAIGSSVNAVIVCFAEGPSEFAKNHPQLSSKMVSAYAKAHPGY